jgi:PhnB protein
MLKDPYGHIWVLLTHQEDLSPEEIKQRSTTILNQ